MQTLTNHWRPGGGGFVRFDRSEKGVINVRGTIACEPTGQIHKCGGKMLKYATYGSVACGKCCAGLPQ